MTWREAIARSSFANPLYWLGVMLIAASSISVPMTVWDIRFYGAGCSLMWSVVVYTYMRNRQEAE